MIFLVWCAQTCTYDYVFLISLKHNSSYSVVHGVHDLRLNMLEDSIYKWGTST